MTTMHCRACKRAGTWWDLNTLACTHATGCALDGVQKVLVCGSRDWVEYEPIRRRLRALPRGARVLHGGCRGADRMAGTVAAAIGLDVREYPADWLGFGRSAGYRRNIEMLNERPDLVLAFQRNGSTGTQHVIDEATKRGIAIEVVTC